MGNANSYKTPIKGFISDPTYMKYETEMQNKVYNLIWKLFFMGKSKEDLELNFDSSMRDVFMKPDAELNWEQGEHQLKVQTIYNALRYLQANQVEVEVRYKDIYEDYDKLCTSEELTEQGKAFFKKQSITIDFGECVFSDDTLRAEDLDDFGKGFKVTFYTPYDETQGGSVLNPEAGTGLRRACTLGVYLTQEIKFNVEFDENGQPHQAGDPEYVPTIAYTFDTFKLGFKKIPISGKDFPYLVEAPTMDNGQINYSQYQTGQVHCGDVLTLFDGNSDEDELFNMIYSVPGDLVIYQDDRIADWENFDRVINDLPSKVAMAAQGILNYIGTMLKNPSFFETVYTNSLESEQYYTSLGGVQLASDLWDGNKLGANFMGCNIVGAEFTKSPHKYKMSRIVNNMKRNDLISVASTSTKDWLVKNGYDKDLAVFNPIVLLTAVDVFEERTSKSTQDRYYAILGPENGGTSLEATTPSFAEYDNIIAKLTAANYDSILVRDRNGELDVYATIRNISYTRSIITNSYVIYAVAVLLGCYPLYIHTNFNDVDYALKAFCKEFNVPFNLVTADTMIDEHEQYMNSQNKGSLMAGTFELDIENEALIGNPWPQIKQHLFSFFKSVPWEWLRFSNVRKLIAAYKEYATRVYYLKDYFIDGTRTEDGAIVDNLRGVYQNILGDNANGSAYEDFAEGQILLANGYTLRPRKTRLAHYIYDDGTIGDIVNDAAEPALTTSERLLSYFSLTGESKQLYYHEDPIGDSIQFYGKCFYLTDRPVKYKELMAVMLSKIFEYLEIKDWHDQNRISYEVKSIGDDFQKTDEKWLDIGFPYFIKDPKNYSLDRLKANLKDRLCTAMALESDYDYLNEKMPGKFMCGWLNEIYPVGGKTVINPFALMFMPEINIHMSNLFNYPQTGEPFAIVLRRHSYKKFYLDNLDYIISWADTVRVCDANVMTAQQVYETGSAILKAKAVITDDLLTYMFCKYLNKPAYYYCASGVDKGEFSQFVKFANSVKDTLSSVDDTAIANIADLIGDEFWKQRKDPINTLSASETKDELANYLRWIRANCFSKKIKNLIYNYNWTGKTNEQKSHAQNKVLCKTYLSYSRDESHAKEEWDRAFNEEIESVRNAAQAYISHEYGGGDKQRVIDEAERRVERLKEMREDESLFAPPPLPQPNPQPIDGDGYWFVQNSIMILQNGADKDLSDAILPFIKIPRNAETNAVEFRSKKAAIGENSDCSMEEYLFENCNAIRIGTQLTMDITLEDSRDTYSLAQNHIRAYGAKEQMDDIISIKYEIEDAPSYDIFDDGKHYNRLKVTPTKGKAFFFTNDMSSCVECDVMPIERYPGNPENIPDGGSVEPTYTFKIIPRLDSGIYFTTGETNSPLYPPHEWTVHNRDESLHRIVPEDWGDPVDEEEELEYAQFKLAVRNWT